MNGTATGEAASKLERHGGLGEGGKGKEGRGGERTWGQGKKKKEVKVTASWGIGNHHWKKKKIKKK